MGHGEPRGQRRGKEGREEAGALGEGAGHLGMPQRSWCGGDTGMPRVLAHTRGWSCWHLQELPGLSAHTHREKCILPSSSSFHHCVKCDLEFINYPQKISGTAGSIFYLLGPSCTIH